MRTNVPSKNSVKANAERMKGAFSVDSVRRRLGFGSVEYFYVYGITLKGKPLFLGPLPADEADSIAAGLQDGEVFIFSTRDQSKATKQIKAELLRRGVDPDLAIGRMSHSIDKIEEV